MRPGGSVVAPLGWSAFWRHRCRSATIDLLPASCQAIYFRPAGPTVGMVTVIVTIHSNNVHLPRVVSVSTGATAAADKHDSLAPEAPDG